MYNEHNINVIRDVIRYMAIITHVYTTFCLTKCASVKS